MPHTWPRVRGGNEVYYLGWILLIVLGVGLGIWAFMWAIRSGQFAEQERARFLPLRDECLGPEASSAPGSRVAVCFLCLAGGLVLLSMAAALWLTFTAGRG